MANLMDDKTETETEIKRMALVKWETKCVIGTVLPEWEQKALTKDEMWTALRESGLCFWRTEGGTLLACGSNNTDPDMETTAYISISEEAFAELMTAHRARDMKTVDRLIDAALEKEAEEDGSGDTWETRRKRCVGISEDTFEVREVRKTLNMNSTNGRRSALLEILSHDAATLLRCLEQRKLGDNGVEATLGTSVGRLIEDFEAYTESCRHQD
jgi:hypothetical protein